MSKDPHQQVRNIRICMMNSISRILILVRASFFMSITKFVWIRYSVLGSFPGSYQAFID